MTIKEVVEIVIKDLNSIRVPVSEFDGIGQHIARSVSNLKICVSAMEQAEKEAQEKAKQDNVVPMESKEEAEDSSV